MKYLIYYMALFCLSLAPAISKAQGIQLEADIDAMYSGRLDWQYGNSYTNKILGRVEATPSVYINAIRDRIVLPGNTDLINYKAYIDDNLIYTSLSHLTYIANRGWDIQSALDAIRWLYYEVSDDIDQMQEQLSNPASVDTEAFENALFHAGYLYIMVLEQLGYYLEDSSILPHALERHARQSRYVRGFIESNTRYLAGAFPPTQPLDVTGTWQLVGLPLEPFDGFVENVFSSSTLEQRPFSWDGQQYVYEDTLGAGKGYWVNAETAGTETVAGVLQEEVTLDLFEGWNLIAPPNCGSTDLHRFQIVDENGNTFFETPIFGYGENGYYELTPPDYYLQTGSGYWFKTDRALTITMDCNQVYGSKTMPESFQVPDTFGIITVKDEAGGNQTLYFGSTLPEGVTQSFAMPPLPFEGTFDARLVDDARLTEDEMATIRVQVQQYPLTVVLARPPNTNNVSYVLETMVNNQIVRTQPITPGSPIQVMSEDVSILRIRPE